MDDKQSNKEPNKQTDKQTDNRQTNKQTNKQMKKQINKKTLPVDSNNRCISKEDNTVVTRTVSSLRSTLNSLTPLIFSSLLLTNISSSRDVILTAYSITVSCCVIVAIR